MDDAAFLNSINDLKVTVNSALSAQTIWNQKHDEHSQAIIASIDKKFVKLFSMHENVITKVGAFPCNEHDTRMKLNKVIVEEKIGSTEKRVGWLWGVLGVAAFAVLAKVLYEYIKNPI